MQFSLVKKLKDAHSRIIWGISWAHDDKFFATASREKQKSVKVWKGLGAEEKDLGELYSELPEENPSATAISFFPSLLKDNYGLVVGLESGDMNFWIHNLSDNSWCKIYQIPNYYTHCSAVRRIKFNSRYSKKSESEEEFIVASCANDHSVRLFSLKF